MASRGYVGIKHDDLGLESEVLEESLPVWLASGWVAVDDVNEVKAPEEEAQAVSADEVVEPEENE